MPLGVWWWNLRLLTSPGQNGVDDVDHALDLLLANHVNEIYLCIDAMQTYESAQKTGADPAKVSELDVRGFVKKCARFGIRVAAMTGASGADSTGWLSESGRTARLSALTALVAGYNARAAADERFYALHLDVEPYNHPDYTTRRAEINQQTADLLIAARDACDRVGLELEWDIWAWTAQTDAVRDRDGQTVNLLDVYARECDKLCVMAYYNKADTQFRRATQTDGAADGGELDFAKKYGCRLLIASELTPNDDASHADTTYANSTLAETQCEIERLRELIDASGYDGMGAALHHMASLYHYLVNAPTA